MDTQMQFDVVLIEDNDNDAELTFRVFEQTKLVNSAVHFKSAETAYQYLINNSTSPKVVLLDLDLGGMSGTALLRVFEQNERTRNLTTVVLTGCLPEHADLFRGTKLLLKPLDESKLRSIVQS